MVKRFDIYLVGLDDVPAKNSRNTRPALVISPDEMNEHLGYVTMAPVAGASLGYPVRVPVELLGSERSIVLDQIRTVDKHRLVKHIGSLADGERRAVLAALAEMFAE